MKTSNLKEKAKKTKQWENLEGSIKAIFPLGSIKFYKLYYGGITDFDNLSPVGNNFISAVKDVLKQKQ